MNGVPDQVIARVDGRACEAASRIVRAEPSRMAIARPTAIVHGRTLVLVVPQFELNGGVSEPQARGPIVTLRATYRAPNLSTAAALRAAHSRHSGLVCPELELLLDKNSLWGVYWGDDGRHAPRVVWRPVPALLASGVLLPKLQVIDDGAFAPLPRTGLRLGPRAAAAWRDLRFAFIGAGRQGSLSAEALAAQGVTKLTLIDADRLEPGNLDGMTLVSRREVDRLKVEVVGGRLVSAYPELSVTGVGESFPNPRTIAAVAAADVLVTAVDADTPRLHANWLSRRLLQIHLDIGTHTDPLTGRSGAEVRLLLPTDRCMLCTGGVAETPVEPARGQAGVSVTAGRRPGTSNRLINAAAAHVGVQMLLALIGGQTPPASRWVRLSSDASGLINSEVLDGWEPIIRCPWCSGTAPETPRETPRMSQSSRAQSIRTGRP